MEPARWRRINSDAANRGRLATPAGFCSLFVLAASRLIVATHPIIHELIYRIHVAIAEFIIKIGIHNYK
jgi:hypothetical protein